MAVQKSDTASGASENGTSGKDESRAEDVRWLRKQSTKEYHSFLIGQRGNVVSGGKTKSVSKMLSGLRRKSAENTSNIPVSRAEAA
jgi:hypothetical protein